MTYGIIFALLGVMYVCIAPTIISGTPRGPRVILFGLLAGYLAVAITFALALKEAFL